MPGFDSIIDQEGVVRRLSAICRKGNIPHAMLFTGHEGVGKKECARVFAMACNCLTGRRHSAATPDAPADADSGSVSDALPCGVCRPCKKIRSDVHPDVIILGPQKGAVRISQVRDLCRVLAMKPYEARQRVAVIGDAHTMSQEAGNALLKVLEEPPDRTLLILTAPHSQNLLPTVVSRCQHFRFKPVSQKALMRLMMKDYGLPFEDAEALSALAGGSIAKARSLAETGWLDRRKWILSMLGADEGQGGPALQLAFAERISSRKDDIPDALDILKSWYRDLMIYPLAPDKVMNKDMLPVIRNLSRVADTDLLLSRYETVREAQERIDGNVNPRLALDVMMMRLLQRNDVT